MKLDLIKNFDGHNVRLAGTPENPLFVAADVCELLGIKNSRDAVASLDSDEIASVGITDTSASSRNTITVQAVTESGLYHLIFKSRKESAKRFRRWVTEEVLPSIRKDGSYLVTVSSIATLTERADIVSAKVLYLIDQLIRRGVPAQSASGLASNVFKDSVRQPAPTLPAANLSHDTSDQ